MTIKGPRDGKLTKYYFGTSNKTFEVEATSLAKAVRAFRVGALFPHQYSTKPIKEKRLNKDGWERDVCVDSKPGAYVPVRLKRYVNEPEIAQIPVEAATTDDFGPALLAVQAHLNVSGNETTALMQANEQTGLQTVNYLSLKEEACK